MEIASGKQYKMEPALVRNMPFLSRKRTRVLKRLNETQPANVVNLFLCRGAWLQDIVLELSNDTIDLLVDTFLSKPEEIIRFLHCAGHALDNDLEVRTVLSYWSVLRDALSYRTDVQEGLMRQTGFAIYDQIMKAVNAARSHHADFMSRRDISSLTGEQREQFAAVLSLYVTAIPDLDVALWKMPVDLVRLAMSRPDRVHDILEFQHSRDLAIFDIDAELVTMFLDTPAAALTAGLL